VCDHEPRRLSRTLDRYGLDMKGLFVVAVVMTMPIAAGSQLPSRDAWTEADRATIRLDPERFTELPRSLQIELRRRGCSIPQPFGNGPQQNVIRGSFIRAGQVDWAALCSRERRSAILIFRNGNPGAIVELARRADAGFLEEVGANKIGFSRTISVASAEFILQHHEWYGGPVPPSLTHVGINDAFLEKASVVWYWHRGRWLQLTGSD
jgi:hypothetical protein